MATVEVLPTCGSVWTRLVEIWQEQMQHEDWSMSYSVGWYTMSGVNHASITTVVTTADDEITTTLVSADLASSSGTTGWGLNAILATPGMYALPLILQPFYEERETSVDWQGNLLEARRDFLSFISGHSPITVDVHTDGGYCPGLEILYSIDSFWKGNQFVVDSTCVSTYDGSGDLQLLLQPQLSQTMPTAGVQPQLAAGGSRALDLIAAALEELSLSDMDLTINNGSQMFSIRGKVRIG